MAAARPRSSSVVSPIAETTTTRSLPAARSRAIRRATRLMRSASATDEPPYFWTTRGLMGWDIERAFYRAVPGDPAEQAVGWHHGGMCFDLDSRPPIFPIAGGALDGTSLVLTGADGNRFLAFRAHATEPTGAGIVILPDVRGLHPYYEELALRFAEAGIDALAFDYFGRTAGIDTPRDDSFEYQPHVAETTWPGITSDLHAAADEIRADGDRVGTLFTIGFCMGGRAAFVTPTLGLGLAGAIGFYGSPTASRANIPPIPAEIAPEMEGAVLGLFGGADTGIPQDAIATFEAALTEAGVEHRLVSYDGAPHSFFDRKATEFADASAAAWDEVLGFIRARTPKEAGQARSGPGAAPTAGIARLDDTNDPRQVRIRGRGDEGGFDPGDPRHRIGEGEDGRSRAGE